MYQSMNRTMPVLNVNCFHCHYFRYCIKHFNSLDTSKNVYLMLLKVYLKPPNREKPMLEPALDILARHGTNIDPTSVSNLPLSKLGRNSDLCIFKLLTPCYSFLRFWDCFQQRPELTSSTSFSKSLSGKAIRPNTWI
jgi:hypothetical protein